MYISDNSGSKDIRHRKNKGKIQKTTKISMESSSTRIHPSTEPIPLMEDLMNRKPRSISSPSRKGSRKLLSMIGMLLRKYLRKSFLITNWPFTLIMMPSTVPKKLSNSWKGTSVHRVFKKSSLAAEDAESRSSSPKRNVELGRRRSAIVVERPLPMVD